MINLLPNDRQMEIRAGRTNIILARYISILVIAVAFLIGVLYITLFMLQGIQDTANNQIKSNDAKIGGYADIQQKIIELNAATQQAKTVLTNEARYTTITNSLTSALPTGVVLSTLDITAAGINTQQLTAVLLVKGNTESTAAQTAIRALPLFTGATFTADSATTLPAGYTAAVKMTATINNQVTQ